LAPARPLAPVLTPTHSAQVSIPSSLGIQPVVTESPAVVHTRRVSGIPASLQKTIADEAAARRLSANGATSPLLQAHARRPKSPMPQLSRPESPTTTTLTTPTARRVSPASAAPGLTDVHSDDDEPHLTPKPRPGPMTRRRTAAAMRASEAVKAEMPEHAHVHAHLPEDGPASVARHDVSTPPAKAAASLLARLQGMAGGGGGGGEERGVLSPRDANGRV
jgi:hypothetical protein